MQDGFYYICKPQWEAGVAVMTQKEIFEQYVRMRLFTFHQSQGATIDPQQGYAMMHKMFENKFK